MGLRCNGCGYDNDPTRVYCHNCGVKLERGSAAPPAPTGFTHPTDVANLKRPRGEIAWGKYFTFLLKFCVLCALAATVVLALIPPRDVPVPVAPDENLANRLTGLISVASSADSPRSFAVPFAEVQRWLVTVVRFERPDSTLKLDPQRVYSLAGDGHFRVGVEASLLGAINLFFEGDYAPVPSGGGYSLEPLRYTVGRLPLPPFLGWPVERQLDGLREALAAPLQQLSEASYIGVAPDSVTLRWGGNATP